MNDFFDRLDEYMIFSKLNDNQLTVKAGLSIGSLGKQRKGSRGLSSDSIAKILYCCENLSADWLLTGRGEMLRGADGEPSTTQSEPTIIYRDNPDKDEIIELQRKYIALLEDELKKEEDIIRPASSSNIPPVAPAPRAATETPKIPLSESKQTPPTHA